MSESSGARLTRLLALVPWLQAHPDITLDECARHFGISVDQLESDLWMVIMCGVPGYGPDQLIDIQFWDDGHINVIDVQTLDRPMRLSPDESVALLVGLRMLAQVPGVQGREAIITAAAKLEATVEAQGAIIVDIDVTDSVRAAITQAMSTGQAIDIEYAAATSNQVTDRVVIPEHVHVMEGAAYLEAWCTLAGARRTFRLDRILKAEVVVVPEEVVNDAGAAGSSPHEVRLAILPSDRWVVDLLPEPDVAGTAGGALEVTFQVRDLSWAAVLVLSRGGGVVALEPPELVGMVSDAADNALRSYS